MRKICSIVLLACGAYFLFATKSSSQDLTQYKSETMEVEIKGEVHSPGVYEVAWHAKVKDVIEAAGGCTQEADMASINQSQDLINHDVIVIPKQKEQSCISLNTASLEELDTLPGIGPKVAQRIIDYRGQTPFQSLEDIKEVKGIGDKLYLKLKDQICL